MIIFTTCSEKSTSADEFSDLVDFGQFTAEVTGSENQSFSGVAVFSSQAWDEPVGNIFGLGMSSLISNDTFGITIAMIKSARPSVGTYAIQGGTSDRTGQFTIFNESANNLIIYRSISGEMEITNSTAERLAGEIFFIAKRSDGDEEVEVTARFNARCQQTNLLFCD